MGFKCKVMQLEGQLNKEGQLKKQEPVSNYSWCGHADSDHSHFLQPHSRVSKDLEDEKKSLEAVNTQLKEDLEALANKKSIAEEEKERLRQDFIGLQQQVWQCGEVVITSFKRVVSDFPTKIYCGCGLLSCDFFQLVDKEAFIQQLQSQQRLVS